MAKLLLLDFETVDNSIGLGLGAGWVFAANGLKEPRFEIVGWAISILDTDTMTFSQPEYINYTPNWKSGDVVFLGKSDQEIYNVSQATGKFYLQNQIEKFDGIIAHNITYELGCLKVLGIDVPEDKDLYDTNIIAKLVNNEIEHRAGRSPFSLENLSEVYLPVEQRKAIDLLIDHAIEMKLVDEPKRKGYNIERFRKKVQDWCYNNMDKLSPEVVGEYCNQDLIATGNLFKLFIRKETA